MAVPGDRSVSNSLKDRATNLGPEPAVGNGAHTSEHRGVVKTGDDGSEGEKAFYIHLEARPGKEEEVCALLWEILDVVNKEPTTGPWFGLRYSRYIFGIFEAFARITGRDRHTLGDGGAIFGNLQRMNELLAKPAHIYRLDVLLSKHLSAGPGEALPHP